MTRLENLPGPVALKRMMAAMITLFCDSFKETPRRLVLDIDDTEDRAYGEQQLSLFNTHHDSNGFMPIHIYEATMGKPVAVFLRPGKTPAGPRPWTGARVIASATSWFGRQSGADPQGPGRRRPYRPRPGRPSGPEKGPALR